MNEASAMKLGFRGAYGLGYGLYKYSDDLPRVNWATDLGYVWLPIGWVNSPNIRPAMTFDTVEELPTRNQVRWWILCGKLPRR